jgi:hypothetical protein
MRARTLVFGIVLLISHEVDCNIAPPQACISEIYVESPISRWIELGFYEDGNLEDWFDSLVVETRYGSSIITDYPVIDVSSDGIGFPCLMVIYTKRLK